MHRGGWPDHGVTWVRAGPPAPHPVLVLGSRHCTPALLSPPGGLGMAASGAVGSEPPFPLLYLLLGSLSQPRYFCRSLSQPGSRQVAQGPGVHGTPAEAALRGKSRHTNTPPACCCHPLPHSLPHCMDGSSGMANACPGPGTQRLRPPPFTALPSGTPLPRVPPPPRALHQGPACPLSMPSQCSSFCVAVWLLLRG